MSGNLVNYYADNCTVEISIADEKHVVGKFSGTFVADDGSRIVIKAGSFDIPINKNNTQVWKTERRGSVKFVKFVIVVLLYFQPYSFQLVFSLVYPQAYSSFFRIKDKSQVPPPSI